MPAILVLAATAQQSVVGNLSPHGLRISGTAVNATTGRPLKDIEVAVGPVSSSGGQKTNTDSQGGFVFDGLATGKYWLVAQGRGFPRQTYDEHEGFSSAIVVGNKDVPSEGIVFRLRPGASISGAVMDDFNEPVRHAGVTLFRAAMVDGKQTTAPAQHANTDDQGRYRFSHLLSGSYLIAVSAQPWYAQGGPRVQSVATTTTRADGSTTTTRKEVAQPPDPLDVAYPLTFYAGTTDVSSATPVVVKPGDQASADVTMAAVPARHLRIPLIGAEEHTFYTLSQHVLGNAFQLPLQSYRSDGEIEIGGIAPGHFTLEAQANGPNPVRSSQEINVLNNGAIAKAELSPPITARGLVTLEGDPVFQGVFVQLRGEYGVFGSPVSEKGEFQIAGPIHSGTYDIAVYGIAGGVIVGSVARDSLPPVDGNKIELTGSGPTQLVIRMARGLARVEGVVLKEGKPFPGAMVVLVPEDFEHHPSRVRRDQSDSDGTFLLGSAAPGKYKVVAIQNGWSMEWSNPAVLKPYLKAAEWFELTAHQKYTVKVTVQ